MKIFALFLVLTSAANQVTSFVIGPHDDLPENFQESVDKVENTYAMLSKAMEDFEFDSEVQINKYRTNLERVTLGLRERIEEEFKDGPKLEACISHVEPLVRKFINDIQGSGVHCLKMSKDSQKSILAVFEDELGQEAKLFRGLAINEFETCQRLDETPLDICMNKAHIKLEAKAQFLMHSSYALIRAGKDVMISTDSCMKTVSNKKRMQEDNIVGKIKLCVL